MLRVRIRATVRASQTIGDICRQPSMLARMVMCEWVMDYDCN